MTNAFTKIILPKQTGWCTPIHEDGAHKPQRGFYQAVFFNLGYEVKSDRVLLDKITIAIRHVEHRSRIWPWGAKTRLVTLKEITLPSMLVFGAAQHDSLVAHRMDRIQTQCLNKGFDLDPNFLLWVLSGAEKLVNEILREINDERSSNKFARRRNAA